MARARGANLPHGQFAQVPQASPCDACPRESSRVVLQGMDQVHSPRIADLISVYRDQSSRLSSAADAEQGRADGATVDLPL